MKSIENQSEAFSPRSGEARLDYGSQARTSVSPFHGEDITHRALHYNHTG